MTEEQVRKWLPTCSLDAFKDALQFGPQGVKDLIRTIAVEIELNDVAKRDAIKEFMDFDVTKAIELNKQEKKAEENAAAARRIAPSTPETPPT